MHIAYSYTRFSSPNQATTSKLQQQHQRAQKYAEENDLALDESLTLQDLGVSAFRSANIECGRLGEFLSAVRTGFVEKGSYLLVENLDRLSRDTVRKAIATLEDICDEGITVVTLMDNQKYTADRLDRDPAALLISLVIFLRANEESKTKGERTKAAYANKLERAARGEKVILSWRLPTWLRFEGNEIVVDQEKVKTVKRIYDLAELGLRPNSIARTFNIEKIPTMRSAKYWRAATVWPILTAPSTTGLFLSYYRDRAVRPKSGKNLRSIKNYYPRVISQKKWNRVQAKLKKWRIKPKPGGAVITRKIRNIFGRLAICPNCGDAMSGCRLDVNPDGEATHGRYMACCASVITNGCNQVHVEYAPLERTFLDLGPQMMRNHLGTYVHSGILGRHNIISAQVSEIIRIAGKSELDRGRINHKLRRLFDRVVINYNSMMLEFEWSSGGKTGLPINEVTRIRRLGERAPQEPNLAFESRLMSS